MNWFYKDIPEGIKTPSSELLLIVSTKIHGHYKSQAIYLAFQVFLKKKKILICTYFVSLKILTPHCYHKYLFVYILCGILSSGGVLVLL